MAYKLTFVMQTLAGGASDLPARRSRAHLLEALTECAMFYLQAHPEVPRLRAAGVRVYDDSPGQMELWDIPTILLKGAGSAESIAAWAAAEARVRDHKRGATIAIPFRPVTERVPFVLSCLRSDFDREHVSDKCIKACLRALTKHDVDWLRAHPSTPSVYASGVRYEEEPLGADDWADIPTCLKLMVADCEDLACWRAAELRVRHRIAAGPKSNRKHRPRGGLLYHIVTKYPDGRDEDPSRRLGMR